MTSADARPAPPPNNLVGLALVAAFLVLGFVLLGSAGDRSAITFGFVLTGWILAVMAHEFGHAATAWLAGDHTVREKGYLAFDPRRYGDVGTSLVIPVIALALGGIGFPGGAVYLRHDLMRSPAWRAAASLAGPGATLAVLVVLAIVLNLFADHAGGNPLYAAVAMLAFLQAMALILNLLPLPGLDGFNAIRPFLPEAWAPALRKADALALVILLAAVFLIPGFSTLLFGAAASLAVLLGVPLEAIQAGWDAFFFWK
jgi:Zn-dependent protease